jgi:hypothetical protein
MKELQPKFISFTTETNALDYLERAGEFIDQVESNPKAWKWVILCLHSALYGFAIAACKSTDSDSVVRTSKKGKRHLISLDEALAKCADASWMGTLYGGLPLNLTVGQKDSLKRLKKDLRNKFEHFTPDGWSIEIHGLPRICTDVLDIIRFLAVETFRYQHLNDSQRHRVKSAVIRSKRSLKRSSLFQETMKVEGNLSV